jgi:hypothetical protein
MRGRYFQDMSIVRAGGENTAPAPKKTKLLFTEASSRLDFGSL